MQHADESLHLDPQDTEVNGHDLARIVVSRTQSDDFTWLQKLRPIPFDLWTELAPRQRFLQQGRDDSHLVKKKKPMTARGGTTRECGGYLAYIIENYDHLPNVSFFLQAAPLQGTDYHSDSKLFSTIRGLSQAPDEVGYCSLNKFYTNWASVHLLEKWRQALDNATMNMPGRFSELQQTLLSVIPRHGGSQCFQSAQFAVSRERILAHPKRLYLQLLDFVQDGPLQPSHRNQNRECGLLEATWHILFGAPSVCSRSENSCRVQLEGSTEECTWIEYLRHLTLSEPLSCPKPSAAMLAVQDRGM